MLQRSRKLLWMLVFVSGRLLAQDTLAIPDFQKADFIKSDLNIITNSVNLTPFFEKLYQLKKTKNTQINIVQIGDSHIQADFLSNMTRQLLQKDFGNGGRGLIFPGRVARSNEPQTISSQSTAHWEAKRIVFTEQELPIGIGAMTIRTSEPNAKLSIRTINTPTLNYSFNKITVFFQKDFSSFNLAIKDSVDQDIAFIGPYTFEPVANTSSVILPFSTNQLILKTLQPTSTQSQLTLFGINVENSRPGLIYHSIGGNGAKFKHYLAAKYFTEQTSALHPDLFIISLGTNEAIEYPYVDPQFTDYIDFFISKLRAVNPSAQFILTLPPDFFKKRTRRNPGVENICNKIRHYAEQKNISLWDLFEISGGKHSADLWRKNGLMQSDGIHFTKSGYELQGKLLYEALIKGYNEYVLYRYP